MIQPLLQRRDDRLHAQILGKIKCKRNELGYRKLISVDDNVYENITSLVQESILYNPNTLLESKNQWYRLTEFSHNVGLSNICYTVLDEIMECIFWRFPSKRSHWEAVIISIIISFELYSEIFKREETMRGIKAFVILAMTAFYFPIVSWGKGTNLFVLDA